MIEIIVSKKVRFFYLASPTNKPNLPVGNEEVRQPILMMRVGILFPDYCAKTNEAGQA